MSRRIDDLIPSLRLLCRAHLAACAEAGLSVLVTYTLRTLAEQEALYAQGRQSCLRVNALRTAAGLPPITEAQNRRPVTWTMSSKHLPGPDGLSRAYDIAIRDGSGVTWDLKADGNQNQHPDYQEAAEIGRKLGLECGYYWRQPDPCHYQMDLV